MVLAEVVYKVDPEDNWLDYLSAAAAVVGIVIALVAQYTANKARREVAEEPRKVFELEALRDLAHLVDDTPLTSQVVDNPAFLRRYENRIRLLPESALPYWQRIMAAGYRSEVCAIVGFSERAASVDRALNEAKEGKLSSDEDLARLANERATMTRDLELEVRRLLLQDLRGAIDARVGHTPPGLWRTTARRMLALFRRADYRR